MGALLVKNSQGSEVRMLKQRLREILGTESDRYPGLDKGDSFDADTESAVRHWQSGIGIIADGVVGPHCLALLGLRKPGSLAVELSASAVQKLFPATKPSNIVRYLPYVAAALDVAGLNDRPMICAALGTIRAESEGFLPIAEYPSQYNTLPGMAAFSAYDGRKSLGNIEPGDGAIHAPWPLLRLRAETGLDGVPRDVADRLQELGFTLLEHGAEAILEQVRIASVAPVEAEGVTPVECLHCTRELAVQGLQDQVVVVRHQAVAEAPQVVDLDHASHTSEEVDAIGVEGEDRLPIAAAREHVVDPPRDELAGRSTHAEHGRRVRLASPRMWMSRHTIGARIA